MNRTLLILRHGKSLRDPEYETDFERPLAPRGIKASQRMGKLLSELNLKPDLIATSPAVRALSTAKLVHKELDGVPMVENEDIYAADARVLLDVAQQFPDSAHTVLLVGHNPGLEELIAVLTGDYEAVLKTCSLAVVRCPAASWDGIEEGSCECEHIYHPRELKG